MNGILLLCFSSILVGSAAAVSILEVGLKLTLAQPTVEWKKDLVVNATCVGTCPLPCTDCSSFDFTVDSRGNKTYTRSQTYSDFKFHEIQNLTKSFQNECTFQQTVSISNLKLNESGKITCSTASKARSGMAFLYLFQSVNYTDATLPTETTTKEVDMESGGGKVSVTIRSFNASAATDNAPFISCTFESASDSVTVHWSWANGTSFSVDQNLGTQSTVKGSGNQRTAKFVFDKFSDKAAQIVGKYKCLIETNVTFYPAVNSKPVVKMSDKDYRSSMEGDVMTQSCTIIAYPAAVITWSKDNQTLSAEDSRISFSADNATLTINDLKKTDAGLYICTADNGNGIGQAYIKLRVKDRLAALWPFLGILAEVIILVAIILLYERKRSNQKRSQEEQEAAEVNKEERNANDSDVRHRPVKT